MPKWLLLKSEFTQNGLKVDQNYQTRNSQNLGTMDYEIRDRGLIVAMRRFCQVIIHYVHFFGYMGDEIV